MFTTPCYAHVRLYQGVRNLRTKWMTPLESWNIINPYFLYCVYAILMFFAVLHLWFLYVFICIIRLIKVD